MPEMAFHVSKNPSRVAVNKITTKAFRVTALFGAPIFLIVFFMAEPLLHLWLRKAVAPEQPLVLKIMLIGTFLSLLGSVSYHSLIAFEQRRAVVVCHIVQSLVNIVVSFFIVFKSGYSLSSAGAALATTCGMACATAFLQVWWSFRLDHQSPKIEEPSVSLHT